MGAVPHIDYFNNQKAWIRGNIFKKYMVKLNAKYCQQDRKIVRLLTILPLTTPRSTRSG